MICYFEPNFVEIRLRKSGFSIFVVLHNHAEGKSVGKWFSEGGVHRNTITGGKYLRPMVT